MAAIVRSAQCHSMSLLSPFYLLPSPPRAPYTHCHLGKERLPPELASSGGIDGPSRNSTAPMNRRSPHSRPHDDSQWTLIASNLREKTVASQFLFHPSDLRRQALFGAVCFLQVRHLLISPSPFSGVSLYVLRLHSYSIYGSWGWFLIHGELFSFLHKRE